MVTKTKATEQAESQKKLKEGEERLRRWFSGWIWCCECSTKLRLTEQCLVCRLCDDMFNQERHGGLRVSSWSFQFICVPAVTGGYGVQTTGFILHLAYLTIYFWKIHLFAGRAVKRERRKGSSRRQQPVGCGCHTRAPKPISVSCVCRVQRRELEYCSYRVNRSNATSPPYASSFSVLKSTLFLSQVTACSDLIFSRHRHILLK